MNYIRVKICGICDLEDAFNSVRAGADALGFIFAPSKRRIAPEHAYEIISRLPPYIAKVGVFVNPSLQEVIAIASRTGLDTIQLHGRETPEFCSYLKSYYKVVKAYPGEGDYKLLERYKADAFLLDTAIKGLYGGTGKIFNWHLAANFKQGALILAGGLNPENVREAINITKPYAVDVSSGVETNGKKDFYKINAFIRRVKIDTV